MKPFRLSEKPNTSFAVRGLLGLAALLCCAAVLVYYWRVFYYLDARGVAWLPLFAGVSAAAAALYAGCLLAMRFLSSGAAKCAAVVLLCGLLFVFANPPMQTPDETSHFLRAWRISEGCFTFDASRAYPEDVSRLTEAFPGAWVNAHTSQGTRTDENGETEIYDSTGYALKQYGEDGYVESFADSFAAYFDASSEPSPAEEPLNFAVFPYLACAAGMALVRLFGANALVCFYAGRIANLLVYALLAYAALRVLEKSRTGSRLQPLFLAVLALPMSLYMAGSFNYDAILLGCYAFAAAHFFADELDTRGLLAFLAVFLVMNAIKPWINLLWLAALFFIPKQGRTAKLSLSLACVIAVVLAVLISRFVDWYGIAFRVNYPEIGRQVEGAGQLEQLLFVLKNPLRYIAVLLGTLYENDFFIGQLGVFGALDLPVSAVNLLSPVLLLTGAVLSARADEDGTLLRRSAGAAVWAVIYAAGAMTAMYITWTPVGMVRIIGLQARYFIPCFLLLGTLPAALFGRALTPRAEGDAACRASLLLSVLFAALSALLLWQHCFIGPFYTI